MFLLERSEDATLLKKIDEISLAQGRVIGIPLDVHVADVGHLLLQTLRFTKGIRWFNREPDLLFLAHRPPPRAHWSHKMVALG